MKSSCSADAAAEINPEPPFFNEKFRYFFRWNDQKMAGFSFKKADPEQSYRALELVQDVYTMEGYVNEEETSRRRRILKNHFYDETAIFIGEKDKQIVFTVSLFPDSCHQLPMDEIFGDELDQLREQGRSIGEVGCLATHPDYRDGSQNIPMNGNKIILNYAIDYLELDSLVIAVHPKHAPVYKEVLLFEALGQGKIKNYPKVNNNPAVALHLDLHNLKERYFSYYRNTPEKSNVYHFVFVRESDSHQLPLKPSTRSSLELTAAPSLSQLS